MQKQEHQANRSGSHKRFLWMRVIVACVVLILIVLVGVFNLQASLIIGTFSVILALFQWLFPNAFDKKEADAVLQSQSIHTEKSSASTITAISLPEAPLLHAKILASALNPAYTNSHSIFLFNEPLNDISEYFGRIRERTKLLSRTGKGVSTSIVGQRKIGKTWLMNYLRLNLNSESRYRICLIDASMPSCNTILGFTRRVLEGLGASSAQAKQGLARLEKVVRDLTSLHIIPVVCIDEFEVFSDRNEFDLDFFKGLRAITQIGLCLVIASKKPLIDIVGEDGKTSGFFNVFEQLTLKPFTLEEAEDFAHTKGGQAGFTNQERMRLLQYGQEESLYWPLRLQLVGQMLYEDKNMTLEMNQRYYKPEDPNYWQGFDTRLREKYQAVVR